MKKIFLLILVFSFCNIFTVVAKDYEYWGDEYFENDSLSIDADSISQQNVFQFSTGLFAKPLKYWRVNIITAGEIRYDVGNVSIVTEFPQMPHNFSTQMPIKEKDFEQWIREKDKFSNDYKYSGKGIHHDYTYDNIGIAFEFSVPTLHSMFSISVGYCDAIFDLYSPTVEKYFLGYDGEKRSFLECSVLELNNLYLYGAVDIKHPIYGGFMRMANYSLCSYYYLSYGIGCDFGINDKISCYNYILTQNSDLRYSNGEIRETFISNERYNGIEKLRPYWSLGFGWNTSIDEMSMEFAIKYKKYPNSLFKEQNYNQNILEIVIVADINIYISLIKTLYKIII